MWVSDLTIRAPVPHQHFHVLVAAQQSTLKVVCKRWGVARGLKTFSRSDERRSVGGQLCVRVGFRKLELTLTLVVGVMDLSQQTNCGASFPLHNHKDMPTRVFLPHQSGSVGARARLDSGLESQACNPKLWAHGQHRWRTFLFDFLSAAVWMKSNLYGFRPCVRVFVCVCVPSAESIPNQRFKSSDFICSCAPSWQWSQQRNI